MDTEDDEWFELSEDFLREPGTKSKKFKICTDANVPQRIVDEIRKAGIPVNTAYDSKVSTHTDKSVLAWVRKLDRVLLTLDKDFWDDRKFPFQKLPGVLYIDIPPEKIDEVLEAFWFVYYSFAKLFGGWERSKIRATRDNYLLKGPSFDSGIICYEFKIIRGRVMVREFRH